MIRFFLIEEEENMHTAHKISKRCESNYFLPSPFFFFFSLSLHSIEIPEERRYIYTFSISITSHILSLSLSLLELRRIQKERMQKYNNRSG
jgi:hypothetical protein